MLNIAQFALSIWMALMNVYPVTPWVNIYLMSFPANLPRFAPRGASIGN
jgi:hypothetical protein